MKNKITLVLALVLTVVIAGMIACNSSKRPSKNKEGITEITGPSEQESISNQEKQTVTIMGWDTTGRH